MGIKDENYVIAPVKVAEAKEPEKSLEKVSNEKVSIEKVSKDQTGLDDSLETIGNDSPNEDPIDDAPEYEI